VKIGEKLLLRMIVAGRGSEGRKGGCHSATWASRGTRRSRFPRAPVLGCYPSRKPASSPLFLSFLHSLTQGNHRRHCAGCSLVHTHQRGKRITLAAQREKKRKTEQTTTRAHTSLRLPRVIVVQKKPPLSQGPPWERRRRRRRGTGWGVATSGGGTAMRGRRRRGRPRHPTQGAGGAYPSRRPAPRGPHGGRGSRAREGAAGDG